MTIAINPSNNQDVDGLLWGWAWGDGGHENLTFSFPTGTAEYIGYTAITGFNVFNADQQTAVRNVLGNIAGFADLTFTETTAPDATLRYAEASSTDFGPVTTAYAVPPQSGSTYAQGDSWYHTTLYDNPLLGTYANMTIMHETGHSLGLKHGHVAQNGHGVTFPALPADHDSFEYSIMTYRQFPGDSTTDGDNALNHPATYMQDDIAALQYMYGANYGAGAHNGNTVYTWSTTTGEAFIDGVGQGAPIANYVLMTIWDGGGTDTYDLSNYATNLSIDLNPGAWMILDTSVAHTQRANLGNTGGGPTYFARGNVANALTDPNDPSETLSLIENAVGGTGDDTLVGNGIGNTLWGNDGNDQLYGLGGVDTMYGGNGDDVYTVDDVGDVAAESSTGVGSGEDTVRSSVSYTLGFGFEHLTLTGTVAINGMGNENNNLITGNSGSNTIEGGVGDDTLNGGVGTDTASYSTATAGVTVNLSLTTAQNTGGAGSDTLSNLENLTGSNFNDTLIGTAGNNVLNGLGGTDTVSYANATAGVTVDLNLTTAQNTVGAGTDTILNVENLTGSNFNDTLTGNSGNNVLSGGGGNDLLDGGTGSDFASYANAASAVTVNLSTSVAQNTIGTGTDTLSNFEHLRGSNFNDTLTGNAASNVLIGHLGDDVLDGGAGTDTASYETATAGVTVSLAAVGAQNTVGAGTDTLLNFEHLRGGVSNDTLTGNNGSNIITGGLGNDTLDGGAGSDTASYDTAFGGVTVSLLVAGAQNTGNAGIDTLSNFENLKGSIHNDTLTGNAASNVIIGDLGNDILNGDAGIDTVSYETAKVGVTVSLAIAGAQNTVGAGTDTLSNFENIRGGNFNDTLTGNTGANSLFGGLGNDTLTGNSGSDSFVCNTALNATTNNDVITDFSPVDDTLVLENAIFTQFAATGAIPAGTFVANAGAVAGDANDFLLYDINTGKLFYDADGNGAGAKVEFVTLVGIPALTAADFSII